MSTIYGMDSQGNEKRRIQPYNLSSRIEKLEKWVKARTRKIEEPMYLKLTPEEIGEMLYVLISFDALPELPILEKLLNKGYTSKEELINWRELVEELGL